MVVAKVLEKEEFEKMLLEKLKRNFTEKEIYQLLKELPKEKSNLILMINKEKQDAV